MYRYAIVLVISLTLFIGAFDRANVALLLVDPGFLEEMGLEGSPERQGLVMTVMLLPYALSNIFLGFLADRWGPRRVLAAMTGLWTAAALLLGVSGSYIQLLVGRAIRGLAEGPLFPVANRYIRNWFPTGERGLANALWTNGQRLGLALSVPVLVWFIASLGWRSSFFLQMALIAALLIPSIWLLTADRPAQMSRVTKRELALIAEGDLARNDGARGGKGDLRGLLRNPHFWLAVSYHLSLLGVYFGLLTWLPKYLKEARGFDVGQMVVFTMMPQLFSVASSMVFGSVSDRTGRRAIFCVGGMVWASVAICLAALAENPVASAWLLAVGFGGWAAGVPAYYAIMQRLVPGSIVATGIGIDNGLSNFASALAPTVVGFLIGATGSYLAGLLFLAGLGVAGAAAAMVLAAKGY